MTTLPITEFGDQIVESVTNNAVTIVQGQTGSGKSTQVPQFLADAGYDVIVTQPRRLAARSLAERVAEEMGTQLGQQVGYQVSGERFISKDTEITFVTDGLQMVRELIGRDKRRKHRVLVIDEVHEWNLNVEVLVAWARKRVMEQRFFADGGDFRVVLMSATLDAQALSKFFLDAPVIEVPGRLFPITERPAGTSLTADITALASEGHNTLVFVSGKKEIDDNIRALESIKEDAIILPLHGELSPAEQRRCFDTYDKPKIIVATNVAQTSVTIPDITAVVDSGLETRKELVDGVEGLYIKPVSKACSKQRAGRAGRTGPGIYINHNPATEVPEFPVAEINRVRLDQTILRLAEINIDMEDLVFLHQPNPEEIHKSKQDLIKLQCLDSEEKITQIGRHVSRLPNSVAGGRMIVEAVKLGNVKDVIVAAAILEVGGITARTKEDEFPQWRFMLDNENESDLIGQCNLYRKALAMNKPAMWDAGIHVGSFGRVKDTIRQLTKAAQSFTDDVESTASRVELVRAIAAGMVHTLHTTSGTGTRYRREISDTILRVLSRDSVIRGFPTFLVGKPFDVQFKNRRGSLVELPLLTMATKVTPELMAELAPHLVKKVKSSRSNWDAERNCVMTLCDVFFDTIFVGTEYIEDKDYPDAASLRVQEMYAVAARTMVRRPIFHAIMKGDVTIPMVEQVSAGKHPETGKDLLLFGSYEESMMSGSLIHCWYHDQQIALNRREGIINLMVKTYGGPRWKFAPEEKPPPEKVKESIIEADAEVMRMKLEALKKQYARR